MCQAVERQCLALLNTVFPRLKYEPWRILYFGVEDKKGKTKGVNLFSEEFAKHCLAKVLKILRNFDPPLEESDFCVRLNKVDQNPKEVGYRCILIIGVRPGTQVNVYFDSHGDVKQRQESSVVSICGSALEKLVRCREEKRVLRIRPDIDAVLLQRYLAEAVTEAKSKKQFLEAGKKGFTFCRKFSYENLRNPAITVEEEQNSQTRSTVQNSRDETSEASKTQIEMVECEAKHHVAEVSQLPQSQLSTISAHTALCPPPTALDSQVIDSASLEGLNLPHDENRSTVTYSEQKSQQSSSSPDQESNASAHSSSAIVERINVERVNELSEAKSLCESVSKPHLEDNPSPSTQTGDSQSRARRFHVEKRMYHRSHGSRFIRVSNRGIECTNPDDHRRMKTCTLLLMNYSIELLADDIRAIFFAFLYF